MKKAAHLLLLFLRRLLHWLLRRRLRFGFLVPTLWYQLAYRAARRPELDRNDPGVADDLAAVGLHLLGRLVDAVDLHGEVVDARPLARPLRLGRLGAGVVLDERHVEHAV